MRFDVLIALSIGSTLALAGAAPGQPAPSPAASPAPQADYGPPITNEQAKAVAAAAFAEARKNNSPMAVAIVGPAGELVYFEKMDNCQFASISISQHKARTAARYRRPTLAFENLIGKGPYFSYLTTLDDVIASRGGNPLMVGGKVVGAIGVSGGSGAQDDTLSQAGVAVLK